MSLARLFRRSLPLLLLAAFHPSASAGDNGFRPVTPEELALKSVPDAPGVPAVLLYREERSDDNESSRFVYLRMKILTEAGLKYADVEIRYFDSVQAISDLKARTIHPDGSIVEFTGQPFDKTIVKVKGLKYLAKVFTMPDVTVGSIIEYRFTYKLDREQLYNTHWELQDELFTVHEKFHLTPYRGSRLYFSYSLIPSEEGVPRKASDDSVDVEMHNVPALEIEDYMPLRDSLEAQVHFYYVSENVSSHDEYWKIVGKAFNKVNEGYIGHRGTVESAANSLVSASDPPEVKARKLYDRVLQFRNLSFERARTEQEQKAEKLKDLKNIEDVWNAGYGYGNELTLLYAGLARAAGLDATVLRTSDREDYHFDANILSFQQLPADVVVLHLSGKDVYLEPGAKYVPYGLLPWYQTDVDALRLDKNGGTFVKTPAPSPADTAIRRTGNLMLDRDGTLHGELTVQFTGLAAAGWRYDENGGDEAGRKKDLETEVKGWFPNDATVTLKSVNSWDAAEEPLEAHFTVQVPGFGTATGKRLLFPSAIFGGAEEYLFSSSRRMYPLNLHYAFERVDSVSIRVPASMKVEAVPNDHAEKLDIGNYSIAHHADGDTVNLERHFSVAHYYFSLVDYERLRGLLYRAKNSDGEQVLVTDGKTQ